MKTECGVLVLWTPKKLEMVNLIKTVTFEVTT